MLSDARSSSGRDSQIWLFCSPVTGCKAPQAPAIGALWLVAREPGSLPVPRRWFYAELPSRVACPNAALRSFHSTAPNPVICAVAGVAGKAGVADAADGRVLVEAAGEFAGVGLAAVEPQGQGAQAA